MPRCGRAFLTLLACLALAFAPPLWAGERAPARGAAVETGAPKGAQGAGGWLEVTPLGSFEEPRLVSLDDHQAEVRLAGWKAGLALVCAGGEGVAVDCAEQYLAAAPAIRPPLARGARIAGAVLSGGAPVRGARVALVPKRLTSRRLLTLPLALDRKAGALVREVRTDAAGRFATPELAPGEYRLEVNAPGGLILHGDPFALPAREALLPKGAPPGSDAVLDLGAIEVPAGAAVEISVHDAAGLPVAGARVGGSQGDRPETTRFFETEAGTGGRAVVSGFDPARGASFACVKPGYVAFRRRFESLPTAVDCTLVPLSSIDGKVTDEDGKPIARATLSLTPGAQTAKADGGGRFSFGNLDAGAYRLTAAAPGRKPERLAVDLPSGARRALAPIALAPGREVRGLVRDAATKSPIAGATLSAVDPPGAAEAESAEDGTFALTTDDAGKVTVAVDAAGYPEKTVEVPLQTGDGAAPWVVELSPGGRIEVDMWDEEADGPCQGCSATINGPAAPQSLIADGSGIAFSAPLAPGVYSASRVEVKSLGWVVQVSGGREIKQVEVRAGETARVSLGERRRRIAVRLHPDVAGWELFAAAGMRSGVAEILGDGSRRIEKPEGQAVRLSLGRGYVDVELGLLAADDDRRVVDLDLPQTEVSGAVRGEHAPAALLLISAADPSRRASTPLPADGRFSIPFLPPGLYTLLVDGRAVRSVEVRTDGSTELGEIEVE